VHDGRTRDGASREEDRVMSRTRRAATIVLLGSLLTLTIGCDPIAPSPTATPSPSPPALPASASPSAPGSPSASPTESPAADLAWTYQTADIRGLSFGDDGTAWLFTWSGDDPSEIVALDRAGTVLAGWPQPIGDVSTGIAWGPVVARDGSVLVLVFAYGGSDLEIAYELHRFEPDGTAADGWPKRFGGGEDCGAAGPDAGGRVIVACATAAGSRVTAFDASGGVAWEAPLGLAGATDVRIGSGGTIYVGAPAGGGIAALSADGEPAAGWPVRIDQPYEFVVGAGGTVLAWWRDQPVEGICNEGGSTVFLLIAEDGGPLPGWPQVVQGPASAPALADDGRIYVTAADDRLLAFEADGSVADGWPIEIAGTTGTCFGPPDPVIGPDGTVFVATGGRPPDGALTAVSPDGDELPGWPFAPDGELAYPCLGCTPGPSDPAPPILSGERIFVTTLPAGTDEIGDVDIVSLGRDGAMRPGWPLRLAVDEAALHLAPDGRLFAVLLDVEDFARTTLQFIPDPPPTGAAP
jgi:hypothetical protein